MNLQELPKLKDSISYIYAEHSIIERMDSAIVLISKEGRIPIPISATTCLLIGPGTSVTHEAIRVMTENGCMAIWCGERMGHFYASGLGETKSAKNLLTQAKACMDDEMHMSVVRKMYALRFPKMKTESMTLNQIRGLEGIQVRKAYEMAAKANGVKWTKRSYKKDDWDDADPINRALSSANALLYNICHAAIISLGYSTGLGFIHTGKQLSFVYDIADIYKVQTTIPAAFEAVKMNPNDVERQVLRVARNYFSAIHLLDRIADDIAWLFNADKAEDDVNYHQVGYLWDDKNGTVSGGINYSEKECSDDCFSY